MSQSENHTESDFSSKLHGIRKGLRLTQDQMAARLGISSQYVSLLEGGRKRPSDRLQKTLDLIANQGGLTVYGEVKHSAESGGLEQEPLSSTLREDSVDFRMPRVRLIPVVGWAHAGAAESYEQLPESWVTQVPTECRDAKAFGVKLEGDSMEPSFRDSDLLIVMPSEEAYSGCFVVARFKDDGVVFRRMESQAGKVVLIPLNDRYQISEHAPEDFSWIYPVWGRWSQLWKR